MRHIRKAGSTVLQRDEDSVLSAGLSAVLSSKPWDHSTVTYGLDFTNDWINSDTEKRNHATQPLPAAPPPRGKASLVTNANRTVAPDSTRSASAINHESWASAAVDPAPTRNINPITFHE